MHIEFETTLRGKQVTVHADDFFEDRSVGISYGPETVWALDEDGQEIELTEEEFMVLTKKAIDVDRDREQEIAELEMEIAHERHS